MFVAICKEAAKILDQPSLRCSVWTVDKKGGKRFMVRLNRIWKVRFRICLKGVDTIHADLYVYIYDMYTVSIVDYYL